MSNKELNSHWQVVRQLSDLSENLREQIFSHATTPFNSYEFLSALEQTKCVGGESGWQPHHFLYQKGTEYGLLICYQKWHSYGEYVFDWSWANAFHQHQIPYYPKLLCAIPFTPAPCTKWLSNSALTEQDAVSELLATPQFRSASGLHYLFPEKPFSNHTYFIERHGNQFHWVNIDKGYADFDDYLSNLVARKRKMILKERQKVSQANIKTQWKTGDQISDGELDAFYACYQNTYRERGQLGYLTKYFFKQVFEKMGSSVRLLVCSKNEQVIACALYFADETTLYGRYWGALEHHDNLHFEACYYQGIELAIQLRVKVFNPGTQGEHKIARGFQPTTTYSYHKINHPEFHSAIEHFCLQEQKLNQQYMKECELKLPFHRT